MINPLMDFYNIANDCLEKHAFSEENNSKTALIYVEQNKSNEDDFCLEEFSFFQVDQWANQFAHVLKELHIPQKSRFILMLPNSPEFVFAFFGCIKAGVIPVAVSYLLKTPEIISIINDSQACGLLTDEFHLDDEFLKNRPEHLKEVICLFPQKPEIPKNTHCWEELMLQVDAECSIECQTKADDAAFWLYTSGTQKKPKAVIHAHRSIVAHDERVKNWQGLKDADVLFNTSSVNWSYFLNCALMDCWRHGFTTVLYNGKLDAQSVCQVIDKTKTTVLMSVPGIYRRLVNYLKTNENIFSTVSHCLSAGEKLDDSIKCEFEKLTHLKIYQGFGMTEHSVYLVQKINKKNPDGSCGQPIDGSRVSILRDDLTEANFNETGILATHIASPGLMLGYHDQFGNSFQGEWFLSGDLAYRDEDNNFFFKGRLDDVINAGGYRISPLEIEEVINQHPQVIESVVLSHKIEDAKTIVVACIVLDEIALKAMASLPAGTLACQPDLKIENSILNFLKTKLADYKIPRKFFLINDLPKNSSGKIQRNKINLQEI